MRESRTLSDSEARALLLAWFPKGLQSEATLERFAPEGWPYSPLRLALHPSPRQAYEETVCIHERMKNFPFKRGSGMPLAPPPSYETFIEEWTPRPTEPDAAECGYLVGLCLWDIIGENHCLVKETGEAVDFGSFRMSAGTIGDFYEGIESEPAPTVDGSLLPYRMDYMKFYMGTAFLSHRADLGPFYRRIFESIRKSGWDWHYCFPRLGMISFPKPEKGDEIGAYDPSASFAREQEDRERDAELERMQANLRRSFEEAVEEARHRPPPSVVAAYQAVYAQWPEGWLGLVV